MLHFNASLDDQGTAHAVLGRRAWDYLVANTGRHEDALDRDGVWAARRACLSEVPRAEVGRWQDRPRDLLAGTHEAKAFALAASWCRVRRVFWPFGAGEGSEWQRAEAGKCGAAARAASLDCL